MDIPEASAILYQSATHPYCKIYMGLPLTSQNGGNSSVIKHVPRYGSVVFTDKTKIAKPNAWMKTARARKTLRALLSPLSRHAVDVPADVESVCPFALVGTARRQAVIPA